VTEPVEVHITWVLLVGLAIIAAGFIKSGLRPLGVPPLVGYLLLGFLLRLADAHWAFLSEPVHHAFTFLADLGVIALLFRVGLDSHPAALAAKLPDASAVWLGNVAGSAVLGFATAWYWLEVELVPALIVTAALTATSVGVAVSAWQEADALSSDNGQLLVDVAELDDLSAVALMAVLFALIPVLEQDGGALWSAVGATGGGFIVKLALFVGACYLFSRYLEQRLTRFVARMEPEPECMLMVLGIGFVIAALAAGLGFSLAIGALFAGLVFSHDPQAVKAEKSFQDLYAFVTPFFFINIGLHVNPEHLSSGAGVGLVLLVAAAAGKFIGAAAPAWLTAGAAGATLIGVSMIPRAEIAMIIMHQGQRLGDWAVPDQVYAGMVFVTMATCIAAPLILQHLLRRWPQDKGPGP
jgi:Kef-type K+ transport system membrane component KefB